MLKFNRYKQIGKSKFVYTNTEDIDILKIASEYINDGCVKGLCCERSGSKIKIFEKVRNEVVRTHFVECKTRSATEEEPSKLIYSLKRDRQDGIVWRLMTVVCAIFPWVFLSVVKNNPAVQIGNMWIVYAVISVLSIVLFVTSLPNEKKAAALTRKFEKVLIDLFEDNSNETHKELL